MKKSNLLVLSIAALMTLGVVVGCGKNDNSSATPSNDSTVEPSNDSTVKPSDTTSEKPSDSTSEKPSDTTSEKPSDSTSNNDPVDPVEKSWSAASVSIDEVDGKPVVSISGTYEGYSKEELLGLDWQYDFNENPMADHGGWDGAWNRYLNGTATWTVDEENKTWKASIDVSSLANYAYTMHFNVGVEESGDNEGQPRDLKLASAYEKEITIGDKIYKVIVDPTDTSGKFFWGNIGLYVKDVGTVSVQATGADIKIINEKPCLVISGTVENADKAKLEANLKFDLQMNENINGTGGWAYAMQDAVPSVTVNDGTFEAAYDLSTLENYAYTNHFGYSKANDVKLQTAIDKTITVDGRDYNLRIVPGATGGNDFWGCIGITVKNTPAPDTEEHNELKSYVLPVNKGVDFFKAASWYNFGSTKVPYEVEDVLDKDGNVSISADKPARIDLFQTQEKDGGYVNISDKKANMDLATGGYNYNVEWDYEMDIKADKAFTLSLFGNTASMPTGKADKKEAVCYLDFAEDGSITVRHECGNAAAANISIGQMKASTDFAMGATNKVKFAINRIDSGTLSVEISVNGKVAKLELVEEGVLAENFELLPTGGYLYKNSLNSNGYGQRFGVAPSEGKVTISSINISNPVHEHSYINATTNENFKVMQCEGCDEAYMALDSQINGKWDKTNGGEWTYKFNVGEATTGTLQLCANVASNGDKSLICGTGTATDDYDDAHKGEERMSVYVNGEKATITTKTYSELGILNSNGTKSYFDLADINLAEGENEIKITVPAGATFRLDLGGEVRVSVPKYVKGEVAEHTVHNFGEATVVNGMKVSKCTGCDAAVLALDSLISGKWDSKTGAEWDYKYYVGEATTGSLQLCGNVTGNGDKSLIIGVGAGSDDYEAAHTGEERISVYVNGEKATITTKTYSELGILDTSKAKHYFEISNVNLIAGENDIKIVVPAGATFRIDLGEEVRIVTDSYKEYVAPEVNAQYKLPLEQADHYDPDDFWGYKQWNMGADTPVENNNGATEDGTSLGWMTEGCKETLTFTSDKASKVELGVMMAYNADMDLSKVMTVKFNGQEISMDGKVVPAPQESGNYYEFHNISFGEVDLVAGKNVLEITLIGQGPNIDDVVIDAKEVLDLKIVVVEKIEVASKTLEVNEESTVKVEVTNEGVTYKSSDETVATVASDGTITGVKAGKVTITVSKEGCRDVEISVTVNPKPIAGQIKIEAEDSEKVTLAGGQAQVENKATASGGKSVGYLAADTSVTIKVTVDTAGTYTLAMNAGSGNADWSTWPNVQAAAQTLSKDIVTLTVNGAEVNIADKVVPGGEANPNPEWFVVDLGNITLVEGENTIVFSFAAQGPNLDYFLISPNN